MRQGAIAMPIESIVGKSPVGAFLRGNFLDFLRFLQSAASTYFANPHTAGKNRTFHAVTVFDYADGDDLPIKANSTVCA
jgi:hypothetical protein